MSPGQGALALLRLQNQLDSWAADRLTLSRQLRTQFTLPNGTTAVTLGPTGTVAMATRPMFLNSAAFLVPGASPAVESPIAVMTDDAQYASISIKTLSSALPISCFYQVNLDGILGTLIFWPVVNQNVDIAIYTPEQIGVPASLNTVLTGPSGYAEAFMYQLALRLCSPFGVQPSPLTVDLAAKAFAAMKRPNVQPGLLGVDAALTLQPMGGRYNVITNTGG